MTADRRFRWPLIVLPAVSALFVYLLTFKAPFTPILNESDHHMFLYEGMRLIDGDVMYRDFFQFTFPGSQAWYWLMFSIFGLKYWILPATIVLIAAASTFACTLVSRAAIPSRLYLLPPIIFIFFGYRWEGLDGTHRMFSPIFVMLAIWAVARGRNSRDLALAGALCAAASLFTQQRGFLSLIAFAVYLVLDRLMSSDEAPLLRRLGVLAASYAFALLSLIAYFALAAGIGNFVYATVEYPAKYYHFSEYNNFSAILADLRPLTAISGFSDLLSALVSVNYLFILPTACVVFWIFFFIKRKHAAWSSVRNVTLVALTATALTFTVTAPNTSRLFQVSMPGLIVLAWLISELKGRFAETVNYLMPAFVCILILLGISQAARVQMAEMRLLDAPAGPISYRPSPIIDGRYQYLVNRTSAGDRVFEAYQPYIYFPLHLRNPTKYGQMWPSDYTRPEQVADAVSTLAADPPRFILWNNDYNLRAGNRLAGDNLGPLADFISANYEPIGEVIEIPEGKIQIWEKLR